jgi:hypothetical protein
MEGRVDGPFRRSSPCFLLVAQIDHCTCVPLIHLDADAMELLASPLDGVVQSSPVVSTLLLASLRRWNAFIRFSSLFHETHRFPHRGVAANALVSSRDRPQSNRLSLFAVGIKQRGRCKVVRDVFDSPGKVERILDARVEPEAIERWMSE